MAGYIGTQAVSVNTTSATISDDLSVGDDLTVTDDATIGGTLGVTGITDFGSYQGSSVNSPVNIKSDSNHFALSLEENSGTETWQLGIDADGDLNFHNSGGGTPSVVFNDSGDVAIGSTTPESNTNFIALTVGPGASTGGGQVYVESSSVRAVFGADNNGSDPKTIIGTTTNHPIVFFQNNADVGRFDANENLTIKTGNIIIGTAGKGIDFSATSDGAGTDSSELFDDYEEGTFSGNITNRDFSGGIFCNYTKVGRMVFIQFDLNTMTGGTETNPELTGLPYAISNLGSVNQGAQFSTPEVANCDIDLDNGFSHVHFRGVKNGTTAIALQSNGETHKSGVVFSNGAVLRGVGMYFTDS